MVKTETPPNYTEAQVARIEAVAASNGGAIDKTAAAALAAEFGKNVKSVTAKAVRMGIYRKAEKQSTNGGPVERKEEIVADIAAIVGANLEGLEKAPKLALQHIRSALNRD